MCELQWRNHFFIARYLIRIVLNSIATAFFWYLHVTLSSTSAWTFILFCTLVHAMKKLFTLFEWACTCGLFDTSQFPYVFNNISQSKHFRAIPRCGNPSVRHSFFGRVFCVVVCASEICKERSFISLVFAKRSSSTECQSFLKFTVEFTFPDLFRDFYLRSSPISGAAPRMRLSCRYLKIDLFCLCLKMFFQVHTRLSKMLPGWIQF